MAITLDSSVYLSRTTNLIDYNSAYTLMAWFYITTDTNGTFFNLRVADESADIPTYDFYGLSGDGSNYVFETKKTASIGDFVTPSYVGINQWFHFAAVRTDISNVQCYQNGSLITSPATVDMTGRTPIATYLIGRFNNTYPSFTLGYCSDYFAYNRALSQVEIQQQMYLRLPQNTNGLIDWCPFNQDTINKSGSASSWTVAGSPTYTASLLQGSPTILRSKIITLPPVNPTYYSSPLMLLA